MKHYLTRTLSLPFLGIAAIIFFLASCSKEYSYENPANSVVKASGSLWDASGNCLPATLGGTWYDGVTPGDTNYVDITVNVSKVGYYAIYTDVQNGLYLADSGSFTSLGETTVRLKPVGTFVNYGNTTFTVTYDTTACSFTIPVKDSTGTGLGGNNGGSGGSGGTAAANTWTFTAGGHVYTGPLSGSFSSTQLGNILAMQGTMASGGLDTLLTLAMGISGSAPAVGSYKTSASNGFTQLEFFAVVNFTSTVYIYQADATNTGKVVTYKITSYDASTKTVQGTFDGTARNASGASVAISNGAFNCTLQ